MHILGDNSGLAGAIGVLLVIYLGFVVLMIIAWVRILQKAGYSGAWVLIALVPLVNLVMFLVFAFSTWPVIAENRALRAGGGGYPPPYPQQYGQPPYPQQYGQQPPQQPYGYQ